MQRPSRTKAEITLCSPDTNRGVALLEASEAAVAHFEATSQTEAVRLLFAAFLRQSYRLALLLVTGTIAPALME